MHALAAACGPGGWAKPAPWEAGGGPRVHKTNNSPNPILALLSADLRPVCMRRKRVAEYS
jgi:hypothetical protein